MPLSSLLFGAFRAVAQECNFVHTQSGLAYAVHVLYCGKMFAMSCTNCRHAPLFSHPPLLPLLLPHLLPVQLLLAGTRAVRAANHHGAAREEIRVPEKELKLRKGNVSPPFRLRKRLTRPPLLFLLLPCCTPRPRLRCHLHHCRCPTQMSHQQNLRRRFSLSTRKGGSKRAR